MVEIITTAVTKAVQIMTAAVTATVQLMTDLLSIERKEQKLNHIASEKERKINIIFPTC